MSDPTKKMNKIDIKDWSQLEARHDGEPRKSARKSVRDLDKLLGEKEYLDTEERQEQEN